MLISLCLFEELSTDFSTGITDILKFMHLLICHGCANTKALGSVAEPELHFWTNPSQRKFLCNSMESYPRSTPVNWQLFITDTRGDSQVKAMAKWKSSHSKKNSQNLKTSTEADPSRDWHRFRSPAASETLQTSSGLLRKDIQWCSCLKPSVLMSWG